MPESIKQVVNETITTAVTGQARYPQEIPGWVKGFLVEANFTYGSGGTKTIAWLQTSVDGVNWTDVACFAFTTSSARKIFNLNSISVTSIATPGDGALADNTAVDGIIGNYIRGKITTTGTYAATTLTLTVKLQK